MPSASMSRVRSVFLSWPSLLCSGVGVSASLSSSPGLFGWLSWLLSSCSDSMMMAGP